MATARPVIGLTGGVASGKSSVARAFEARHAGGLVDADLAARAVVEPGTEGLAAVVAHFGPEVLAADGRLDRAALRARVFGDAGQRKALEALLHPRIRAWMLARAEAAPTPYVVLDIPLLAEGGGRATWPMLDRIVVVDVPVPVQRARLMARDGIDAALAERMIAAQATRAQRLALADDVLVNLGSLADLDAAVGRLDARWHLG
ncbi:dephospho-CoA kinase [Silanimonas sp.]|jgi:dephospho-CoA kinase|uniref:dephospho-CoA kinase n=1 Tax=Silanimonas sp. TaxID=1929290 RepID=UPI0022CD1A56|nr:dephospho-CoA kinase [Silanimonas sp.]MCZ8062363.1 dephospho-CoA kinase [Silanimonas sp.]